VSLEEPKKIEDALKDSDWVNAMHEELTTSLEIKFGYLLKGQRTTI
jgi:hypothetical protein